MEMEHDWLAVGWKALVTRGVIGIVLGVMAMVWPIGTAIALALLFGVRSPTVSARSGRRSSPTPGAGCGSD